MTCSILTKNYDLSVSHKFKRLFWWGVDAISRTAVTGIVTPVVFSFQARWIDLAGKKWNELHTWDRTVEASTGVTTVVPTVVGGGIRKFVKFMKSVRFRQVNFIVSTTTTGTTNDGPVRIFSLTAFIGQKQTVSRDVS
jgi:deoxyhypusine synthase